MSKEILFEVFGVVNPHQIIGMLFSFECQHDSHQRELVGRIEAYEMPNKKSLVLTVSNRYFWGSVELISLTYVSRKWVARAKCPSEGESIYEGTFTLLK